MSGAGFPTFSDDLGLRSSEKLEVPDEWGKSSDGSCPERLKRQLCVVSPDEWGESFDLKPRNRWQLKPCLNPRCVGKSSDLLIFGIWAEPVSLNPRFVGQVFRRHGYFKVRYSDES